MSNFKDLTGQRFGRLVVLEKQGVRKFNCGSSAVEWKCKCDCGNEKIVLTQDLKSKKVQSCGCFQIEARMTHQLSNHKLYRVWVSMINRCYDPKTRHYKDYGGRGIFVCEEWRNNFKIFYDWCMENNYEEGLTVDRTDNDKEYSPSNCRLLSIQAQQFNKRNNIWIEYNGERRLLKDWSVILNIKYSTLFSRIYTRKWDIERAFSEPIHTYSRNKKAK